MIVDQGLAIVGAAALAIIGAVIGAGVQSYLATARRNEDRAYDEALEGRRRVREFQLRRIDQTRRLLERGRLATLAMLSGHTGTSEVDEVLAHADLRLVADANAARRWGDLHVALAKEVEEHVTRTGQPYSRPLSDTELQEMRLAQNTVNRALDEQEMRALRDEPVILLDYVPPSR